MKKYLNSFLVILFAGFFLAGCASTKISLQESSPIALVSIVGNTRIPWVDEEEETSPTGEPEAEGLLSSMASRFTDSQNPEILTAVDRLDYAYDSASLNILEMTGCVVIPKEKLISSEAYTYLRPSYFNMLSATKNASGMKDLSMLGAKNARYFMNDVGAKSILMLSFTFQKEIVKGTRSNGIVGGVVTLKAKLLNERGREVINQIFTARTPEPIKIIGGQYSKESLIDEVNDAIDSAIRQFCAELSRMSVDSIPSSDSEISIENTEIQPTPIKIRPTESAEN